MSHARPVCGSTLCAGAESTHLTTQVDVTAVGLDAFARYEGLLEAVLWTEAHVISDVLLFLCAAAPALADSGRIKLRF